MRIDAVLFYCLIVLLRTANNSSYSQGARKSYAKGNEAITSFRDRRGCCSVLSGLRCPLPHLSDRMILARPKPWKGPEGSESQEKPTVVPGGGGRQWKNEKVGSKEEIGGPVPPRF